MTTFLGFCDDTGRFTLDRPEDFRRYLRAKLRGEEVELLLRKRRTKRSARANAALHAGLTEWMRAKGLSGAALTEAIEQTKDDLLALRWGYIVRQNRFTGEVIQSLVKPHTADLSTAEFSELFEMGVEEAAKDGHYWELPDEFKARKAKERRAA